MSQGTNEKEPERLAVSIGDMELSQIISFDLLDAAGELIDSWYGNLPAIARETAADAMLDYAYDHNIPSELRDLLERTVPQQVASRLREREIAFEKVLSVLIEFYRPQLQKALQEYQNQLETGGIKK